MGHIIQNFEELTVGSELRRDAIAIAEAGYEAINVGNALRRKFDSVRRRLTERRVFFVGIGKCAFAGAEAIEELLGDKLTGGIAFDVSPTKPTLAKIEAHIGTHPLPSEENAQVTNHILEFLSSRTEEDLVIFLISGGGSTLLCTPEAPLTPAGEAELFKQLTAQGATIQELNTVRKHLSRARGGGLARAAYPAEVISLIVSDVPGDDIAFISSGPTILDTSTIADAEAVLARYIIALPSGAAFIESEKEASYFERVTNLLFLTSHDALTAMRGEAAQRGYATEIIDDHFSGEARDIGRMVVEKLHAAPAKTALLYAGESTVTLGGPSPRRSGLLPREGGRNQELALAALEDIHDGELVLPFASDGHDNTDHAGAIGDSLTLAHAQEKNLSVADYLDAHRSYDFFSTADDALLTGYTRSNVSDLIIALKH